jgi:hypothetical protein
MQAAMRKLTDCNTGHSPNQRDEQRLAISQRQIMPAGIFAPYRFQVRVVDADGRIVRAFNYPTIEQGRNGIDRPLRQLPDSRQVRGLAGAEASPWHLGGSEDASDYIRASIRERR